MAGRRGIVAWKSLLHGILISLFLFPVFLFLWKGFIKEEAFTAANFIEVFVTDERYLLKFWKSLGIALGLTLGQMAVGIMAAYGLSIYRVPGRRGISCLLLILLLLPVQVLLVPQYMILDRLGLLNTVWAILVPYFFLPFSAFFLLLFFEKTDREVLDAARLDGTGSVRMLVQMVLPMEKEALGALGVLVFLNAWSMVEQPMAFLRDMHGYPLAVYLMTAPYEQWGRLSALSFLSMLPVCMLAMVFGRQLYEKI